MISVLEYLAGSSPLCPLTASQTPDAIVIKIIERTFKTRLLIVTPVVLINKVVGFGSMLLRRCNYDQSYNRLQLVILTALSENAAVSKLTTERNLTDVQH